MLRLRIFVRYFFLIGWFIFTNVNLSEEISPEKNSGSPTGPTVKETFKASDSPTDPLPIPQKETERKISSSPPISSESNPVNKKDDVSSPQSSSPDKTPSPLSPPTQPETYLPKVKEEEVNQWIWRLGKPDDYISVPRIIEDLIQQQVISDLQDKSDWETLEYFCNQIRDLLTQIQQMDTKSGTFDDKSELARLQFLAEKYRIEKTIRERLEQMNKLLLEKMETMIRQKKAKEQFREKLRIVANLVAQEQDRRLQEILRRVQEVSKTEKHSSSSSPSSNTQSTNHQKFEYYEIKKSATLREISALPEVYGDKNAWDILWQANRDIVRDPLQVLPPGTVLIVPREKKEIDLQF